MNRKLGLFLLSAAAAQMIGSLAGAQDAPLGAPFGEAIYKNYCAVCHGETGAGDGMVGELFSQRPANLQLLSRDNNGVFPSARVIKAIDRRSGIAGHGQTEMPVWGEYFMAEALQGRATDPADADMIAIGRIMAVVYYLEKLQVE